MRGPWRRGGARDRDAFGHEAATEPSDTSDTFDLGFRGVLLAAGGSTRFGSPKQLALLGGQPLVRYAFDMLAAAGFSDGTIVVVGAHGEAVAEVVADGSWENVEIVRCPDWEEGLAASLRAGIAAAQAAGAEAVILHLADLPGVSLEVIDLIVDASFDERDEVQATRATYDGVDGHPVVLPRSLFPALLALQGDHGARELLADPTTRRVEVGHLADPTDVDTPEDLEALQP